MTNSGKSGGAIREIQVDVENCKSRLEQPTPRRPVNGLNVEIGTPLPRCLNKPPVNASGEKADAFRWILSGGSELAFGVCCARDCPLMAEKEVAGK